MTKPEPPPWYILLVRPGFEKWVVAKLADRPIAEPSAKPKIAAYVPMEVVRLPPKRRTRFLRPGDKPTVLFSQPRPIWPGYVFAELPDAEAMQKARDLGHVLDVMSVGENPTVVQCEPWRRTQRRGPDGRFVDPVEAWVTAVGDLVLMEACHMFDESWRPPPVLKRGRRYTRRFAPGEHARLRSGPFAGHLVEVMRSRTRKNVDVLLTFAGMGKAITVDEAELRDPDAPDVPVPCDAEDIAA